MALVIKDRVKETTTTTGDGTINLAGASSGFQSFVAGVGDGNTTYYALTDANGTAWEIGIGTITDASPDTLARTTLLASSTGSKIVLTSGTHTVFGTYPAGKAVHLDASGNLSHTVDISTDTNLAAGTGITLTGDTLSTTDGDIVHDNLSGFVANEHIDWTTDQGSTNIHSGNYTDTNTMGSGFTVSATTDTTATTITQGDDLMFTAGTGITCETTADGTVTISCTVTDTNTQLSEEQVEDFVGGMLGGTETLITVTYQDGTGDIDFVVDNDLSNYDNSSSGFLTAHPNISAASSSDNSGRTYIQDITVDSNGHVTGIATATETVTDTNTMGSGFTVSATTDTNATTITQGDDLMFTAGTGITCETTADGTVTISCTVTDTNTTYTGGTNLTLAGTTFNVDDAFLINSGDDTTTGVITAGGFTTTGTWTFDEFTSGTIGITTVQDSGTTFDDNDTSLMTAAAIADKIEAYGYSTTAGDITGVTAGTGLSGGGTSGALTLNVDASQTQITAVGTIGTGIWQGTAIATAYIADDAITGAKIALFDDSLAATTTHFLIADGTDYSSFALSGDVTCTNAGAVTVAADAITYAKIQNVSATDKILGRDSAGAGVIEEISPASLRTMINVEDGADVTDTTNVTAAGALMDSECAGLAALKATTGTFLSADESKLDGIEASADVTDTTNVTAAGALMDSEVTNLAFVKALAKGISDGNVLTANDAVADDDFLRINGTEVEGLTVAEVLTALNVEAAADVTDTANVTSAGALMDSELTDLAGVKGVTISTLQVKPSEGAFANGDKTKLDAIEASADVTDTTNVTAAGALMDSEVTNLATVKALATGISDGNFLTANDAVADNDFLRIDGTEVEGRTASEVLSDIAAAPAAGSSSIVTVGTVGTGTWQGTAIATAYIADDAVTGAKIALFDDSLAATTTHFLIADGTDYSSFALSGDVTCTNGGVVSIADDVISSAELADACTAVTSFTAPLIEGSTSVQTPLIEYTDGDDAITIHDGGSISMAQAVYHPIANAEAEPEDATVNIDLRKANYFDVELNANVTDIDFTYGKIGQRFMIRFEQDASSGPYTIAWNAVTMDFDGGGSAVSVTVSWPGGTAPTMTATDDKADTYGFVVRAEGHMDGFVIGQNIPVADN